MNRIVTLFTAVFFCFQPFVQLAQVMQGNSGENHNMKEPEEGGYGRGLRMDDEDKVLSFRKAFNRPFCLKRAKKFLSIIIINQAALTGNPT